MSELILVRHGQATPFEADTDRLSALGERQAGVVGAALSSFTPTDVICGPLIRQRETARRAQDAAGGHWPPMQVDPRLAEYDGDGLLKHLAPLLAAQDAAFAALLTRAQAQHGAAPAERNRHFQRMLEPLTDAYLRGEPTPEALEPWTAFRSRVRAFLNDLMAGPSGRTVVVFTSGGVIGLTVATVLNAPDGAALALNWRVRNASLTRLTYGPGRISLDTFNETAHLTPDLHSWR